MRPCCIKFSGNSRKLYINEIHYPFVEATIERDSFQFLYGTGQGWLVIIGAKENITNQFFKWLLYIKLQIQYIGSDLTDLSFIRLVLSCPLVGNNQVAHFFQKKHFLFKNAS